jgi:Leucine-rich repeat (LRR) protein
MSNPQNQAWWEGLRMQEQAALRKTYKDQTGNMFFIQNLQALLELETWDLTAAGLVSLDFLSASVRIKRLIINKNKHLKKLDGIEKAPVINYLECWDTSLKYQPILKKCPNLKTVIYEKNKKQTPKDWENDSEVSIAYDFCELPMSLLKCLTVNAELVAEGVSCWGVSDIYDTYYRHFGYKCEIANAQSLAYRTFKDLTCIVVDFQSPSNHIADLDWLRFFPKLEYLDCSYNKIKNLSGLEYCKNLKVLHCQHNLINDIATISDCPQLYTLDCSHNEISHALDIISHPSLVKINVEGNRNTVAKSPLTIATYDQNLSRETYYQRLPSLLKWELTKYYKSERIFTPTKDNIFVPYALLKSLKSLKISFLTNVLAHLPSLEWLVIFDDLQHLDCDRNQIADLTPLRFCPNLESLSCNNNKITDLNPVNALHKLSSLSFSDNPITDISAVQILGQLDFIVADNLRLNKRSKIALAYNNISIDKEQFINILEPLLTEREKQMLLMNYWFVLQKIKLPMNSDWLNIDQIFSQYIGQLSLNPRKMEGITNISRIKNLNLNNYQLSPLTNLFFLQGLAYLKNLDCCFNQLSNLEGLEQATDLLELDAAFNALTSLQGLQNCRQLQIINIENNPIRDISVLAHCRKLKIIHLNHTLVDSLQALQDLPRLELIYIADTRLSAVEISRFAALRPDCKLDDAL